MRGLVVAVMVLLLAPPVGADEPVTLGAIRVHAWLGKPAMPPIALSRSPLQQIIERLEPESVRPMAQVWESDIARHRQLLQAGRDAAQALESHYRHELLVHPDRAGALRAELGRERKRLAQRFDEARETRMTELRILESRILADLRAADEAREGPASAISQLLRAEIQLARHHDLYAEMTDRWATDQAEREAGDRAREEPPAPFLEPVISALERVGELAPDRLTRERAAQVMAVVLIESGEPERAIATLREVLDRGVSWTMEPELRNRLGDLLLDHGRFAGAARQYGAVRPERAMWYVRARLGLAWCRHRLGDDDAALQAVRDVRRRLAGAFDSSAKDLVSEAERLLAQLIAESERSLPPKLEPRLAAAVKALRARRVELVQDARAPADGRLDRIAARILPLRQCYRKVLQARPAQGGKVTLRLAPEEPPKVVGSAVGGSPLTRCVEQALKRLESLPDDVPAFVQLHLTPVAGPR